LSHWGKKTALCGILITAVTWPSSERVLVIGVMV